MNRTVFGFALAALLSAGAPLNAQRVAVSLRLGDGPVRVSGYYASRPQYVISRRLHCEPDGGFLYCWEPAAYASRRPVVYIYPANRRFVVVERHYRHDDRHWRNAARHAQQRWRKAHRYPDRDVRVVLAWQR